MTSRNWAYLSNYGIYSAMVVFTIAFFAHAIEVAFSVRNKDGNVEAEEEEEEEQEEEEEEEEEEEALSTLIS